MRVAYLLTQDRGGPVDVTVHLAAALQASGEAEVRVFGPVPARDADLIDGRHEEISVPRKGDLRGSRRARAALRAWRPDVVHAQDRRSGLVSAGLGGDIPVVHTYHGVPDDVGELWFRGIPRAPRPSAYTMTVLAADALVARRVDRTVVPAPAMGRFLRTGCASRRTGWCTSTTASPCVPPHRPPDRYGACCSSAFWWNARACRRSSKPFAA